MAFIDLGIALTQTAILFVLIVAVERHEYAAVVNAVVAFAAALTPWLIELTSPITIPPVVTLWLGIAGLLHAIGMLGPYSSISWWDYLTHTVSGAFIAMIVFSALIVATEPNTRLLIAGGTVVATIAIGFVWELIELVARSVGDRYNIPPVLVVYSWRDTVIDLTVDALAAVLVIAFEVGLLVGVFEQLPRLEDLFIIISGIIVGGSAMLLVVVLSHDAISDIEWS